MSTQPSTSPGVWVPPVGGLPEVWTSRASDTNLTASQRNTGNEVGKQVQSAPFGRPGAVCVRVSRCVSCAGTKIHKSLQELGKHTRQGDSLVMHNNSTAP